MSRVRADGGTTLVEVLLSIVILGFSVVAISDAYHTGLRALDAQAHEAQIDSEIRGHLETLLAEEFAVLVSGQSSVTVGGTSHKLEWVVVPVDLDGDLAPEAAAKHVTVIVRDRAIETIVVDSGGWVRKL